jgi:MFS family permease
LKLSSSTTVVEGPTALTDAKEQRRQVVKAVSASAIGTVFEWYDFLLYGVAAATVFPQKFFPAVDPFVGTLLSFSTVFVGFAARPVGAAIFGHYGDRLGRKALLIVTMMTMGVATVGIGLVPSYETIGIWGAVLLTIGRLVQGMSIGGEWSGGVLLAGEWSHPKRRAFTTSFAQAGGPAGMVLANAALALMTAVTSEQEFLDWGWRNPVPGERRARHRRASISASASSRRRCLCTIGPKARSRARR